MICESDATPGEKKLLHFLLFALMWATKIYRCYLLGRPFKIFMDHKPLKGIIKVRGTTSRMLRFQQKLSEYDYESVYRSGRTIGNADALSRADQQEGLLDLIRV